MASALQCPACGYKHRLSGLSGEPVFQCAECGRLLKTPAEYLRPEPSGPSEPPRPRSTGRVQRGGSATRDQTSVLPAAGAAAAAGAARPAGGPVTKVRRPGPRPQAPVALPLRIRAWIAAVGLGAYIVRWFAKTIGWLTGDSLIDVITGSGIGRYLRVFALVPFWALVTALLATLFIEGGRAWSRRRSHAPGRPVRPAQRRVPPAKKPSPSGGEPARRPPAREPAAREPAARQPAPRPPAAEPRAPVQGPTAAETRSPTGAAGAPRPRRIPRRDVTP